MAGKAHQLADGINYLIQKYAADEPAKVRAVLNEADDFTVNVYLRDDDVEFTAEDIGFMEYNYGFYYGDEFDYRYFGFVLG